MPIPTESIGSIPRPPEVLEALFAYEEGRLDERGFEEVADRAVAETIGELERVGSTVVTDGEQGKPNFATYPVAGLGNVSPDSDDLRSDGVIIPFADGHQRRLPRLTAGPFRYRTRADRYLRAALKHARVPVKQAVVAPSLLSLLYPAEGIEGYPRDRFLADLADEAEAEIRACLDAGAHSVQLDFAEGRLSLKLDRSGRVLEDFIALNNRVLDRFDEADRFRIGVHTCPGGDLDSTHSLDVDYADLLPQLFRLHAGAFYIQLASEADPQRVLGAVEDHMPRSARLFVGVTDPIDPKVETPEEVRDRVVEAARYIPVDRLGTCDDCGFAPFADDVSTSRETAFAKIRARIVGTAMASERLGMERRL